MSATTALRRRLSELEAETASVFAALRGAQSETPLSGHFIIVETGGVAALLPAPAVREIVRVVELQPLEGAGPMVAGTFVYRGVPAVAIRSGSARDFSIEAHVVLLDGPVLVGLIVDRVESVVEGATLLAASEDDQDGVLTLCRVGDRVLPLLGLSTLFDQATELAR